VSTLNEVIRREAKNVVNIYRRLNNGGTQSPKADTTRLDKHMERLAGLLEKAA
jgi:DNA-binding sugar fermentation-stimulating protein